MHVELVNGSQLRLASPHIPPKAKPRPRDNMAGNVADFVKGVNRPALVGGDWNSNVDNDPENIGGNTGFPRHGKAIDGCYTPSEVVWVNSVKRLPKGNSDDQPFQVVAQLG